MLHCRKSLLALALLIAATCAGAAQETDTKPPQPGDIKPAQTEQPLLKPEQLDALVAPIALYPDPLVANLLAASTYPLEVVQAQRWLDQNKKLKDEGLKAAVAKQAWDDSVKALMATPAVLSMMSDKLDWTKMLGDAVLAQQADVMEAIQRLRLKAQDNGKLVSTKQQKVSVQQQESKKVVVIEPADPNTMYVPYYEPAAVYGAWPYAEYPPYYFGYPSYIGAGVVAAGVAFGAAFAIARWGNYWGGGCRWGNNNFFINRNVNVNPLGGNWQHNPTHRQGVRYNNAGVQQKFGNTARAGGADRGDFRGRGEQGTAAGRDRPGAGDRASADRVGDRKAGGDRKADGDRKGGGDRAANRGGGDRAKAADRNRGGGANRAGRDTAIRNVSSGRAANMQSARGQASFASSGVSRAGFSGGGGRSFSGGGGGFRGGGGGFRGGGGRRSDIALKHDVVLLGHLDNGLGFYRFSYNGSEKAYVGVIAQEVQTVVPEAVRRGEDGYLRVDYRQLGLKFQTYRDWAAKAGNCTQDRGPDHDRN